MPLYIEQMQLTKTIQYVLLIIYNQYRLIIVLTLFGSGVASFVSVFGACGAGCGLSCFMKLLFCIILSKGV